MEKKNIKIGKSLITQLNRKEFEFENTEAELDFHFIIENSNEVVVIVFDRLIPNNNRTKSDLGVFFVSNLEEAVTDANKLTKSNLKESLMWM